MHLVSPGVGTLSVGGSFLWNGSSGAAVMKFGLSNVNSTSAKLAVTGALTKGAAGTFKFDFQGTGHAATYTLMTFASTTFSTSDFSFVNLASGFSGSLSVVGGTSVQFTVFPVNPPSVGGGPQAVSITLGNLTQTYDGTPKSVTIATSPAVASSSESVTYNGGTTIPTAAGSYVVVVLINNGGGQGVTSGTLTINKATPVVTWTPPAAITFGTALSAAQLNATASIPGTFSYSPASGSAPGAGTQTLGVTFTPTDATDYNPVATLVSLHGQQGDAGREHSDPGQPNDQGRAAHLAGHDEHRVAPHLHRPERAGHRQWHNRRLHRRAGSRDDPSEPGRRRQQQRGHRHDHLFGPGTKRPGQCLGARSSQRQSTARRRLCRRRHGCKIGPGAWHWTGVDNLPGIEARWRRRRCKSSTARGTCS